MYYSKSIILINRKMYKMGTISNEYPFFPVALLKSFLIPWRFISFMKNEFLPLV